MLNFAIYKHRATVTRSRKGLMQLEKRGTRLVSVTFDMEIKSQKSLLSRARRKRLEQNAFNVRGRNDWGMMVSAISFQQGMEGWECRVAEHWDGELSNPKLLTKSFDPCSWAFKEDSTDLLPRICDKSESPPYIKGANSLRQFLILANTFQV